MVERLIWLKRGGEGGLLSGYMRWDLCWDEVKSFFLGGRRCYKLKVVMINIRGNLRRGRKCVWLCIYKRVFLILWIFLVS